MSPNTMAQFLAKVVKPNGQLTPDEMRFYESLSVHTPVVNTFTIVTPDDDSFIINVKKVRK